MSLQDWASAGWLRAHQATAAQVAAQFALVERDLRDAAGNQTEYDAAGRVTREEARELVNFARELRNRATGWLQKEHPELLP